MTRKRARTLEDVLSADPVENYRRAHPETSILEEFVVKRLKQLQKDNPHYMEAFNSIDQSTPDGKRRICRDLDITLDEFQRLDDFQQGYLSVQKSAERTPKQLVRSWRTLKSRAGIQNVDAESFPKNLTRPMLVLFSADWCPPCVRIRPIFGRLVPFFDKAEVRYHCPDTDNWRWAKSKGVTSIPSLIAFFPDGAKAASYPGTNARDIWKTMNELVTPAVTAADFAAHVCTDGSCKILPEE